ncbi:hypothetical protein Cni_G18501 [Canna indica]|uniref:DUF1990 domain-containing protein n=1 Tax=Canna indica TaxID=4628 RepID=A0AAQ3QHR1_9LILI|nr:hypothetical protein Cni_G18501 [Canna indica]
MVGVGAFLTWGKPTREQQKACIARCGDFNYDPKFLGASIFPPSGHGDDEVAVGEEKSLSNNGFFINRSRVLLGSGPCTFDLAKSALLSWKHVGLPWAFVDPETPVAKGERFCICAKQVIPWLVMPLQIAYVRDDVAGTSPVVKAYFGFGSGTLKGHLLAGEERFSVKWDKNDDVWYEVYSFSKPAQFLSVISYPFIKLSQKSFAKQSADAVKKHVANQLKCESK